MDKAQNPADQRVIDLVKPLAPAYEKRPWINQEVDPILVRQSIRDSYRNACFRPPEFFLYAGDISTAFEMVRLILSDEANYERHGFAFSAGRFVNLKDWYRYVHREDGEEQMRFSEWFDLKRWSENRWFGETARDRTWSLMTRKALEFHDAAPVRRGTDWPRQVFRMMRAQLREQNHTFTPPRQILGARFRNMVFSPDLPNYFTNPRDFIINLLFLEAEGEKFGRTVHGISGIRSLARNVFLLAPFENICVVVDPPLRFEENEFGLHCEDGPAVDFGYGQKIFALFGEEASPKLREWIEAGVGTRKIMEEADWPVQVEMVKRIGLERLAAKFNPVLVDRDGDHELLVVELRHPIWFLRTTEDHQVSYRYVNFYCATVRQALSWEPQPDSNKLFD